MQPGVSPLESTDPSGSDAAPPSVDAPAIQDTTPPAERPIPSTAEPSITPPADAGDTAAAWLTRGDRLFVGLLAVAMLVLMFCHWARLSGWGLRPVEIEHMEPRALDYKIDINDATWVDWAQLDGVGEILAERIVSDREKNGPFSSVDDLRRVRGIGPKTLEKLRPWLTYHAVVEKDALTESQPPHSGAPSD